LDGISLIAVRSLSAEGCRAGEKVRLAGAPEGFHEGERGVK
jgi:hypothetical protein